jgi:acetoin utilization protein AcuB
MLASELLTNDFPVVQPSDPLRKAVDVFLDQCICHVPVISENGLEGILPIDLIMDVSDQGKLISDYKDDYINAFVYKDQHGLDVFELMAKNEITAIPVLDEAHQYLGVITSSNLMSTLSNYYSFRQVGGIIVLNVGMRDYDLSEISRIVESNNAKVLILYMDTDEDNAMYKITIKVNTLDLDRILATFERFKYVIDYSHPNTQQKDELKDRYDLLMKLFDL